MGYDLNKEECMQMGMRWVRGYKRGNITVNGYCRQSNDEGYPYGSRGWGEVSEWGFAGAE